MKHEITRFKSLRLALNEIAQFVKDPRHLQVGKPVRRFGGMLPRELLANWLICAAFNAFNNTPERLMFMASKTGDPNFGDGMLQDTVTGECFPTEHVMVPKAADGQQTPDLQARILKAINDKNDKGDSAYAGGKTLVVFVNDGTDALWWPNRVTKALPNPLHFPVVWVVGLHQYDAQTSEYTYGVTMLELKDGNAPFVVIRTADFDTWTVTRIQ